MKIKGGKKQFFSEVFKNASIFDRLFDISCIVDASGTIVYANKAFCTFVQMDKSEVLKEQEFGKVLPIIDEEGQAIDPIEQCHEKEKFIGIREVKGQISDGTEPSLQLGIQPLFDHEDETLISGFLLNIMDKSLEFNLHVKYKDVIEKIEDEFNESVRIFANITDMIDSKSDVSMKMSNMCVQIAEELQLERKETKEIGVAARLHNIGTLGMSQGTLEKTYEQLKGLEKREYEKYPVLGALIFDGLDAFEKICSYIRTHREHYDGNGFPLQLSKEEVPMGGYIVGLARDYFNILGDSEEEKDIRKSVEKIQKFSDIKYHPLVVDAFLDVISNKSRYIQRMERKEIDIAELKVGMRLSSNLHSSKGILLLQADERINVASLQRIQRFHDNDPITSKVEIFSAVDNDIISQRHKDKKEKVKKKRILVVDDTTDLNLLLCMMINKNERYQAEGVYSAKEAIDAIKESHFDAFIFDIMMPEMSGIELLEKLRSEGMEKPVVMCTAKSDHTDVIDAFKKGADDYLVKPVLSDPLVEALDKVLNVQASGEDNDFKEYRKKQLFSVLRDVAPEVLLKHSKASAPAFSVKFKLMNVSDVPFYTGAAESVSKAGFVLTSPVEMREGVSIVFSLIKTAEERAILSGIGKIVEVEDKQAMRYKIDFISVKKP